MSDSNDAPWIQELYDRIWIIAVAALVFFFLSYILWGVIDIMTLGEV